MIFLTNYPWLQNTQNVEFWGAYLMMFFALFARMYFLWSLCRNTHVIINLLNMIVMKKRIMRMLTVKLAFSTWDQLVQFWHHNIYIDTHLGLHLSSIYSLSLKKNCFVSVFIKLPAMERRTGAKIEHYKRSPLQIWINFNPSMDKLSQPLLSAGCTLLTPSQTSTV